MANKKRLDQTGEHRGAFNRNKQRIYKTEEFCGICGKPVDFKLKYPHPLSATIDHIVPVSKGGHFSDISNLQLSHWTCNRQKGNHMPTDIKAEASIISNRVLPQSMDWSMYRAN